MLKLSKKMYKAERQALNDQIEHLEVLCKDLERLFNYNPENLDLDEAGDKWNEYHDLIHEMHRSVKFLDDKYEKRDWTHQDHVQYDLIVNNID